MGRLDRNWQDRSATRGTPKPPSAYQKQLYYDTVTAAGNGVAASVRAGSHPGQGKGLLRHRAGNRCGACRTVMPKVVERITCQSGRRNLLR
jgi:hypothetical protein